MPKSMGRRLAVTPARAMVLELLHHAHRVPSLPLAKTFSLGLLQGPRKRSRLSWTALFAKAYSLVARDIPELRRAYIPYPWPHFYEHPESIATVLVERDHQGESVVLGGRLRGLEEGRFGWIDGALKEMRDKPVDEVNHFRQALHLGKLPGFVRRFVFWHSLYLSGAWRAKRFGTFMISSLGNLGVEQFHPLTFLTTYLTYGPIDANGTVTVKIIYDHRVLDGRTVARALVALEETLLRTVLAEVQAHPLGTTEEQAA